MRYLYSAIALSLLAGTAARADVRVFDNEADFLATAPIVATITFDALQDFQVKGTVEVNGIGFATRGIWQMPGFCSLDRPLGANNIARRHIMFNTDNGERGVTHAVGFRITTFAISPPADYGIVVTTADGAITQVPVDDVTNPNPAYRGFLSTSPIESVAIQAVGGTQFNFCFDDVSRAVIIPATEAGSEREVNDPRAYE
jgi:hypothetical protein